LKSTEYLDLHLSFASHNGFMNQEPDWRVYERLVAALQAEEAGMDSSVTANAKIRGAITGVMRQVDVLVDMRWGEARLNERLIVDAKHYRAKLDVKNVDAFEGMMKDCRANRGIIVCPNGYSAAAKRRAQDAITITLLSTDQLDDFPWGQFEDCLGQCRSGAKTNRKGLVLWDGQLLLGLHGMWVIVWTGKCDCCYNFHAWCQDCGTKFAVRDEDNYRCHCGRDWTTAIEQEPEGPDVLNAVHFFLTAEGVAFPLDRRRLR
jgi:hypothetical protein